MLKELAQDAKENQSFQYRKGIPRTLDYLSKFIPSDKRSSILDIGAESPLTIAVKKRFSNITVENTIGDLDEVDFIIPKPPINGSTYDYIIYSHTIEHQFNPLLTLQKIRKFMDEHSVLFLMLPSRGKLLWCTSHFHEIDHYRMSLLVKRANLKILEYRKEKERREWWFYLTGIRPFMRLFLEYNAFYIIKKND